MRRIRTFVVLGVFLAALFYLGGGWYFSGQIEKGALVVGQKIPDVPLSVVTAESGTVTFEKPDEELPSLGTDMTYGLYWKQGHGRVYGAPRSESTRVTRRLTVLNGTAPAAGATALMDRDVFRADDPALVLGSTVREVEYKSPGGTFGALLVPGSGRSWVIYTHGAFGSDRSEALRAMPVSAALGLPSMAIEYRNDEEVAQDPSGHYQYGRTEWRDLEGAVQYALDRGADDVVLVGYSMGGAITASFLENSPLASRVSRVVLDAPMLDLEGTIDHGAAQISLPLVGQVPDSLVWTAKHLASARYDLDWDAVDYLDDTDWLGVPTLLFHGDADTRVPIGTSQRLRDEHPDLVTLVTVREAGHIEAWNANPRGYERALRTFLSGS